MAGVRVVTDSACDLSVPQAESAGILVVPLTIRFGDEELVDQVDLQPAEFWRRCRASPTLPTTAAPSPGDFARAFARAADEGADGICCLTMSSKVSATYQSARAAAEGFEAVPVEVVDSRVLTLGEGLLALAAAEDAGNGVPLGEVVARTTERIGRTTVLGVLGTLEHLQRGGRIGGARALLGSVLSIKPVIQVKDGAVAEESKQRTRSRALQHLIEKVRSAAPLERLGVANGQSEDIDRLLDLLKAVPIEHELVVADLGPVVGTHAGPASIGVCYLACPPAVHPARTDRLADRGHHPPPRGGAGIRPRAGSATDPAEGSATATPADEATGLGAGSAWSAETATRAVDLVDTLVAVVNDRAVRPLTFIARAVAFGLLVAALGLVATVLGSIALVRLLDDYAFGPRVWISDLIVGGALALTGLGLWTLRRTRPAG